jgi:hypothetical protein
LSGSCKRSDALAANGGEDGLIFWDECSSCAEHCAPAAF